MCGEAAAFGYLNMPDARTTRLDVVERELRAGAHACGWLLGTVFHEEMPGSTEAFERMRAEMGRTGTRRVVVPSFTHFAWHRLVQDLMLQELEDDLSADVVVLDEDLPPTDPDPDDVGVPGRRPCAWCGVPDRWPDRCSESAGSADVGCAAMIESRCGLGDHRRCARSECVVAARWHEPVGRAGVDAARAAGTTWAVVSTIDDDVEVVGTADVVARAVALRNVALWRAGVPRGPWGYGTVYLVRGSDGGLF